MHTYKTNYCSNKCSRNENSNIYKAGSPQEKITIVGATESISGVYCYPSWDKHRLDTDYWKIWKRSLHTRVDVREIEKKKHIKKFIREEKEDSSFIMDMKRFMSILHTGNLQDTE